jgi:putative Ca2+/H+ antiporter (TMEM165/GDT1 family)
MTPQIGTVSQRSYRRGRHDDLRERQAGVAHATLIACFLVEIDDKTHIADASTVLASAVDASYI